VAAETIRLAAEVGLVGGSIEDATGDKDKPLFDIGQATERVAAAAEAARALPFTFMLTARTESFLRGNPNLDDVIKRHGRHQGQVVHCRRARSPAREIRHLRVHRPLYSDTRSRRLHAGLSDGSADARGR
jgi:hypothetical protein